MTDKVLHEAFVGKIFSVEFDEKTDTEFHPNILDFFVLNDGEIISKKRYYSIGGGEIVADNESKTEHDKIYRINAFNEISKYCRKKDIRIWQYVEECEGKEIWEYLELVWQTMQRSIERGLDTEGVLHGGIGTQRKAKYLFRQKHIDETEETKTNRLICAYAYAVSEENASGGEIVTAPTCAF